MIILPIGKDESILDPVSFRRDLSMVLHTRPANPGYCLRVSDANCKGNKG